MLKSFKVHCFLSDPNYLIEINLCKNLFSLGFAWTWFWCKFGQNMQGFKFEKKKKNCGAQNVSVGIWQHQHSDLI